MSENISCVSKTGDKSVADFLFFGLIYIRIGRKYFFMEIDIHNTVIKLFKNL